MKPKALIILLTSVLFAIIISACQNPIKKASAAVTDLISTDTVKKPEATDSGYDYSIMNYIHKISVREAIASNQPLYFSNTKTADTFRIIIPVGPTSKTKVAINIIASDGHLVYTDSFSTDQFLYYSGQEELLAKDKQMHQHITALTQPGFEKYRQQFFDTLLAKMILPHTKLPELLVYSEVQDQDLLDDVVADTDATILQIFCYCYEGTSYVAYSEEKKKGVVILAHD